MSKLKVVNFFCSGGGMSFGLQRAGINVVAGIDFDPDCKETYESNIKAKYILADIKKLKEKDLLKKIAKCCVRNIIELNQRCSKNENI